MREDMRRSKAMGFAMAAFNLLLLSGCAGLGKAPVATLPVPEASARLVDAKGADRGRADFYREGSGLRIELVARGFSPGAYGMHIHAVGQCQLKDFSSAGPHWNPSNAKHGRDNPMGAHHGDLPNLVVETDQIGRSTVMLPGTSLQGDGGLIDTDGAAFVIHAGPDDMKTDPSGKSGARVACGVIRAASN